MTVETGQFAVGPHGATLPNSLVVSYALAIATSGDARRILVAGFDGYGADDPRTKEMQSVLALFKAAIGRDVISITATEYSMPSLSVYGIQE